MNEVAGKHLSLALLVLVALYGLLTVAPISDGDVAQALAPAEVPVPMLPIPQADSNPNHYPDESWELAAGVSDVESVDSQPFEPVVANLTSDILAAERARILSELNSQREGLRRWVGNEIDRTDRKIRDLDSRIEALLPSLASSSRKTPGQNNKNKVARMIYPIVQLRGNGTVGSGVVLKNEVGEDGIWHVWIVTAYHVVEEVRDLTSDKVVIKELRFFDPEKGRLSEICYDGYEVASLPESDLSLIRVDRSSPWPYEAVVAQEQVCSSLSVFDSVYAVGCPLGNQPLPTLGEISSQHKPVGEEVYWMVNAPTYFGNSGGGIFLAKDGELVGISSMIYTYGKRSPMVVPHMGLFVPFQTVRSWLRREGYSYLLGNSSSRPVPATTGDEAPEKVGTRSF
ncbi:MAG: serine protease [Planctomycetota bacterium]|nr:serine protease [Planctomycetota bacterium]